VIYTSGTTGQPKGVMINHGSLSNLSNGLDLVLRENGIDAPLRWAWNAPLMFDAALQAVTQLAVGSELHVLSENIRTSPKRLINYLHRHAIDVLDCTPSLLDILMQEAQFQGVALPNLVIGGEAINAAQWEDIAQAMARCGRVAMNVYGPTEATVDATWARIEPGTVPTIGKPLPNVRVRVLDERLQLVPPGAIGECCIGGAGVARGYLNRDTLTAEKFVDLCFSGEKQRYYRSGDVVRWSSDGRLMYLHRRDTQIKLRGYRIELGEIEHVLLSYPGIVEAAVRLSAKTDSLVAYLVATGTAPEMEAVIEHCRRSLPEYMLPTACVLLQTLPLTRNGKLDVAALPEPCLFGGATENPRPSSPTEQALATVWSRILSRSELPVNGNFFALGGHSLLAIRVISAIRESFGVELPLAGFFEQPTIAQVAALIDRSERKRALPRITRVDNRESLPLSFSQHRLWLIDRLEGGSPQYNMPAAFELCGVFDEEACRRSLDLIVQRHEVLRTTYAEIDGRPVQRVHAEVSMPLPVLDLSGIAQESREEAVERAIRSDARRPFALDRDLMLRAQLLKLSPDNYVLIFNMHHIASDGWSVSVLIREFVTAYRAFSAGENPVMKPLPVQYGDFAYWQRRALANEVLAPEVDYWRRHLAALPHVHSLPLDKPRPIRQTYNGAVIQRRLDPKSLAALKRLIGSHDVTLFMILLSALSALIARWSNEHDIVIGTPVAGRYDESVEALIGFFLNTLILRSDLSGNPCFDEILRRTRENVLAAFSHQQVPFDMLVEALNPERSISHPTLFQIMFVLQNQEQTAFELPTLRMSPVERSMVVAKFDLLLNANETDAGLDLSWNYNTDLFEADTIARMADGYEQILHWIAVDMSTRLQALNLLPDSEANKILREWNDTAVALPYEQCLHALFVDQVRACPDALAVVDNQGDLSYGELFAQAAALAERLRPYAITSESLMGVLLPRGRSQVIATLGILMAGGAYLPLETAWPANRIDQVLAQGNASLLVSHEALVGGLDQRVPVIDLSTIVPLPAKRAAEVLAEFVPVQTPDQLAYVIFTSGSTGKPKGVAIEHRSATNTILDINQRYGVGSSDAVLAVSALSFDLSVYDIFGLLAAGGCIVCPDDERQKDPAHWADLVERYRVSIWDSVPASAELLTAQYEWRERCGSGALRVVMMSGDWIPPSLPARIFAVFPDVEVHSLGGATEGSIWSISYPIVEDTCGRKSVPYGKPLANQRFYVLTDDLATCPVGVAGELHIGGIGVAREYYGDAERTAASYVQHDLLGDRLYKTGDIGRYMPDGNIEFIGRKDSQIKLRGFRIELGEIEAVLARSPYVAEAVVTVQRDSTQVQQLVAYITLEKASRGLLKDWPAELRAHLSTILPNYMVPSHCVVLDAMPLSANNKVDRKRLPEPVWDEHGSVHIDPDGPIEELLTSVWKEVLGRERVSVERNFFEIGGSSVHMIAIAGKTNLKLGAEIGVVSYFEHPTIRAMAKYIASKTSPDRPSNNHEKRSKSRLSQRLAKRDA
jgi:amino acid adenylation domain-containing protein